MTQHTYINVFSDKYEIDGNKGTYHRINVLDEKGKALTLKPSKSFDPAQADKLKMGDKVVLNFEPDYKGMALVTTITKA